MLKLSPPVPFFYGDESIDVLMRKSDRARLDELYAAREGAGEPVTDEDLESLWLDCLASAPASPGGGGFGFWSNVRCGHCATEFPYNRGVRDVHLRLHEHNAIVVDGAVVLGDTPEESWRARIRPREL